MRSLAANFSAVEIPEVLFRPRPLARIGHWPASYPGHAVLTVGPGVGVARSLPRCDKELALPARA